MESSTQSIQNLQPYIKDLACEDIPVGKEKVVNIDAPSSPTSVEHKYVLRRTNDKEYTLLFNLRFVTNGLTNDEQLNSKMRAHVNACLKKYSDSLVAPNGMKIKLSLLDEKQTKYDAISSQIAVDKKAIDRESSHHYSLESSCQTILHELMHLTGLVDEYIETEEVPVFSNSCRSYGLPDSLMFNHIDATKTVDKGHRVISVNYCQCEEDACQFLNNNSNQRISKCPSGSKELFASIDFPIKSKEKIDEQLIKSLVIPRSPIGIGRAQSPNVKILDFKDKITPLYPAHFRSILYPFCSKKNQIYYSCAKTSYAYAKKWIGNCPEKPKECYNPALWLQ